MTDNTAQLQALIDNATGPVTIPFGDWFVNPVANVVNGAGAGLLLRSGIDLIVQGTLHALPTAEDWSRIILAEGVRNVTVEVQGKIIGEASQHMGFIRADKPQTGHGMGVMFSNSSACLLFGPGTLTNCWGDAIYIIGCTDVIVRQVTAASNNRNGMSAIDVDGLLVREAAFNFQNGLAPNAGIDLEPDFATQHIKNVDIDYCQFVGNRGAGVLYGFAADTSRANFSNVRVGKHNTFKDNKPIGGVDTWYTDLSYASLRWMPGYNWWGWPRSYYIK